MRFLNRGFSPLLVGTALVLAMPAVVHAAEPAAAQPDAAATPVEGTGEDIVVTGTRTEKRSFDSLAPIELVGGDSLVQTGSPNLRDALQDLVPSFTNSAGYPGQLGFATKTATLRGLGADETLVLVNGKRRHTMGSIFFGGGAAGQSPTDVDLIPTAAIDHVEILQDGAAAQYGSDAIAGVVNIILKHKPGGSADLQYGQYTSTVGPLGHYGRGFTGQFNQTFALAHDGYLSLSADIQDTSYTNNSGPVPYDSGTVVTPDGVPHSLTTPIYYCQKAGAPVICPGGTSPAALAAAGYTLDPRETGRSRYREIQGTPKIDKQAYAYNLELPLTDAIDFYSFSTYTWRRSQAFGWLRTANSLQNITALNPDGYLPQFITIDNDFQGVAGFSGNLGAWKWDLSTSWAAQNSNIEVHDSLNPSFGTASQRNFDNGKLLTREWVNNLDINRVFSHGLFGRKTVIAGGLEYRRDGYSEEAGEYQSYANGGYVFPAGSARAGQQPNPGVSGLGGFQPSDAGDYWRSNEAVYADIDQFLTKHWEAEISGRYEHYSDFGSAWSGKFSSRYEILPGLALRGTVSNGFHAPTLPQEHYSARTQSYQTVLVDGASVNALNTGFYARTSDPLAVALGAQPLKPELSVNYSLGLVAQPARNLQVTLDLYQIDLKNQILPVTFTTATPAVASALVNAGLIPANAPYVYQITYEANIARTRTRGADLTINYRTDLGNYGRIKWSLLGNLSSHHIVSVYPSAIPGITVVNAGTAALITSAYPRSTIKLSADWELGKWELLLRGTRYSATYLVDNTYAYSPTERQAPAFLLDAELTYKITDFAKFSVGGKNITNTRPSQVPALAQLSFPIPQISPNYTSAAIFSADGPYVYARLRFSW